MWGMDWIELAQDRDGWWALVNAVMDLWVPLHAGNFLTSCKLVSFSKTTLLHEVSKQACFTVSTNIDKVTRCHDTPVQFVKVSLQHHKVQ
jgi:hypothetical protein